MSAKSVRRPPGSGPMKALERSLPALQTFWILFRSPRSTRSTTLLRGSKHSSRHVRTTFRDQNPRLSGYPSFPLCRGLAGGTRDEETCSTMVASICKASPYTPGRLKSVQNSGQHKTRGPFPEAFELSLSQTVYIFGSARYCAADQQHVIFTSIVEYEIGLPRNVGT
jgi:hypothetical protein